MQRLDLKSLRYDRFGKSVLIDGRNVVIEIAHEALEALTNVPLSEEAAIRKVAEEQGQSRLLQIDFRTKRASQNL